MSLTQIRTSEQVLVDADLDIQTNKVVNVVDPVSPQDAATKAYVDSRPSGLTAANFVFNEVPSGAMPGTVFTLANTPTANTQQVHKNGVLLKPGAGNDYTISGGTITFLASVKAGSVLLVHYMK